MVRFRFESKREAVHARNPFLAWNRKGTISLESVMVAAALVPLAIALFMLSMRTVVFVYGVAATLLDWPYP